MTIQPAVPPQWGVCPGSKQGGTHAFEAPPDFKAFHCCNITVDVQAQDNIIVKDQFNTHTYNFDLF